MIEKTGPQHRRPRLVQGDVTTTSPTPTAPPRNRRRARLAAALAALVAIAAFGASPAQAAKAPKDFFGVVPQTTPTTSDFQRLGQGKIGAMRIGIFWSAVDPAAPAGGYDFSSIDPLVASAATNGVEILPYLYGTPGWVATSLDGYNCGNECGTFAPKSDAALNAWAAFVGAVADRYGAERHVLDPVPEHPEGADRVVPDLERAELVGLLRPEGEPEGVREGPRGGLRRARERRPDGRHRPRRDAAARRLEQGDPRTRST